MSVSGFTLIALIISIILVLIAPFSVLILSRKSGDKRISGFLPGVLGFFVAFIILMLFWTIFGMDNVINKFLGTDDTVRMIRQTILYAVYAIIETVMFYIVCRRYCKNGETTPFKALRFAGGYALPETIYVLLYLVLPLVVILSNGSIEFNIGDVISFDAIKEAGAFEYLFKAWWRIMSLCVFVTSLYLVFTGVRFDAKWLYFIVPFINLGLDLPYTYTAINSRKLTADTVVVINVLWKNERFALILMTLTTIISLIICKVIYNNYYRSEEKKALIREKRQTRKERRKNKRTLKEENQNDD